MTNEQVEAVTACAVLSAAGKIHFGDVIARMTAAGVERYHADYTRMETTYYTPDGESLVLPMALGHAPAAPDFSAAGVEAAVRRAQRGEVMYPQFSQLALAAGCVGYFVLLAGRRVQYLGRNGEVHTEWFPGARPSTDSQ